MTYKEPNEIAFARSPILYGVFDALYTETAFRYTCDVYIWQGAGGGSKPSTPQYQLEKYPEPNGAARFNVQSLAMDYLIDKKYTFSTENDTYEMYTYVAVTLNYTYGSTIGTPVVLDEIIVFDGYNYYLEGINFLTNTNLGIGSYSSFVTRVSEDGGVSESLGCVPSELLGLTGKGYFMTESPLERYIPPETSMRLFTRNDSTSIVYSVIINVNDGDLEFEYITSAFTNEISAIKAGTTEIQALANSQAYTTDITTYSIYGIDSYGTRVTQEYIFNVKDACKYGFRNLQFMNRYGVWDNLIVYGTQKTDLSVERTDIMSSPLTMTTSPSFTFTEQYGQHQMRNVHGQETLTVNTGWLDEDWNDIMKEMMLTEHLYDADTLQPYIIDTKDLKFKTSLNEGLINYTIKLKLANTAINTVY